MIVYGILVLKNQEFISWKIRRNNRLNESSGTYRIEAVFRECTKKTLEVELKDSQNAGTIIFEL